MKRWKDRLRTFWTRPWSWRGPHWSLLLLTAVTLTFGLSFMFGSTVLGIVTGMKETVALRHQSSEYHYRQGLSYLQAGNRELALAEFQETLRLNPTHLGAQREVLALLLPTPTPTLSPTPAKQLTPNPYRALEILLEEARVALSEGRWQEAYARLEQIQATAPDFHEEEVKNLLYQAAFNKGMALREEERLEEALRAFDLALRWRPDAREAQRQRDLISAYLLGISYFYVDWDSAIAIFKGLYSLEPNFRDVRPRYLEALQKGAQYHLKRGNPCQALNYLERLREIAPQLVDQQDWQTAQQQCNPR